MNFFESIFNFIILIAAFVVHEFGHYIVAKRLGIFKKWSYNLKRMSIGVYCSGPEELMLIVCLSGIVSGFIIIISATFIGVGIAYLVGCIYDFILMKKILRKLYKKYAKKKVKKK